MSVNVNENAGMAVASVLAGYSPKSGAVFSEELLHAGRYGTRLRLGFGRMLRWRRRLPVSAFVNSDTLAAARFILFPFTRDKGDNIAASIQKI